MKSRYHNSRRRLDVLKLAPALYIAAIAVANIVTATKLPIQFDWAGQHWVVTWGTFFIAATFVLRDAVQVAYGRGVAYASIGVALAVNLGLSLHYDNLAWIVAASCISFTISETLDTEVFTRITGSIGRRIAVSGLVGGTIDSVTFALLGLSPLTTGIVPWEFLWTTVVAQVVIKCAVSGLVGLSFARREVAVA